MVLTAMYISSELSRFFHICKSILRQIQLDLVSSCWRQGQDKWNQGAEAQPLLVTLALTNPSLIAIPT
jgi:hypothetical protein